ncbi:MAG: hypothetical protein RIG67_31210 [Rhodospirillales bacterium]
MTERRKLRLCIVVWGAEFIATLKELCLPALLAPGNLPACGELADVSVTIITSAEDRHLLDASPVIDRLAEHCAVEIIPLLTTEEIVSLGKYPAMRLGHKHFITSAFAEGAVTCFVGPDNLYADGSLSRCLRLILDGKSVIMFPGLRGRLEEARQAFRGHADSDGTVLSIPSRTLVSYLSAHPHAITRVLFSDSPDNAAWPQAVYWRAGQKSIASKSVGYSPAMFDLMKADPLVQKCHTTLDNLVPDDGGFDLADFHYMADTDEACFIELSQEVDTALVTDPHGPRSRFLGFCRWSIGKTNARMRKEFRNVTVIHRGEEELNPGAWRRRAFIWSLPMAAWFYVLDAVQPLRARLRQMRQRRQAAQDAGKLGA